MACEHNQYDTCTQCYNKFYVIPEKFFMTDIELKEMCDKLNIPGIVTCGYECVLANGCLSLLKRIEHLEVVNTEILNTAKNRLDEVHRLRELYEENK